MTIGESTAEAPRTDGVENRAKEHPIEAIPVGVAHDSGPSTRLQTGRLKEMTFLNFFFV